jgi:hypothetical protein
MSIVCCDSFSKMTTQIGNDGIMFNDNILVQAIYPTLVESENLECRNGKVSMREVLGRWVCQRRI